MGYEEVRSEVSGVLDMVELPGTQKKSSSLSTIGGKVSRSIIGRWWRRHPLSSVMQVGQPFLESYAQKHPGKLIAYGAGTGALFWLLKPWKLLSLATVVALVFKSSDISEMIFDVVKKARPAEEEARTRAVQQGPAG